MNFTSNESHDNLFNNITNCLITKDSEMLSARLVNVFVCYWSLCFYVVFSFFSEFKLFYWNFSKLMEVLRSILAGFIISMFLDDQCKKVFGSESYKNLGVVVLSNLPIILLSSVFILVFLGHFLRRLIIKKSNEYNSISPDVGTISPEIIQENTSSSATKTVRKVIQSDIEMFNGRFASIIYLSLIFFHSFFAGLGFLKNQNIGWYEMIICTHKIFEIFRVKQAFDNLNCTKRKTFNSVCFFALLTPLGYITSCFLKNTYKKIGDVMIAQLLENIFAQSFLLVSYFENFIPFPSTRFDVIITWPICFLSYIYFNYFC